MSETTRESRRWPSNEIGYLAPLHVPHFATDAGHLSTDAAGATGHLPGTSDGRALTLDGARRGCGGRQIAAREAYEITGNRRGDAFGGAGRRARYIKKLLDHPCIWRSHPQMRRRSPQATPRASFDSPLGHRPSCDSTGSRRAGTDLCHGVPAQGSRSALAVSSFGATPV